MTTETRQLLNAAREVHPADRVPTDRALVELGDACDDAEDRLIKAVDDAMVGHGDECVNVYDVEEPHYVVSRWLDRQQLFGITPAERAVVERLLRDIS